MHLFCFLFCCHLSHILGAEIAQGQDEPAQRLLRQGGKPGTLVRNSAGRGRARRLHRSPPGRGAGGNVLDAQPVSRCKQAGKRRSAGAAVSSASWLASSLAFRVMHSMPRALAASLAASTTGSSVHRRTTAPITAKPCCCKMRTAALQPRAAAQAHQHLVLLFIGIEPAAGQKCIAHRPCLPPCA